MATAQVVVALTAATLLPARRARLRGSRAPAAACLEAVDTEGYLALLPPPLPDPRLWRAGPAPVGLAPRRLAPRVHTTASAPAHDVSFPPILAGEGGL